MKTLLEYSRIFDCPPKKNCYKLAHSNAPFSSPGHGCSKLKTLLVNVSLNFQQLISQICQYFLLKKFEKLLHCKSFSHFFNKKLQSPKTLNEVKS